MTVRFLIFWLAAVGGLIPSAATAQEDGVHRTVSLVAGQMTTNGVDDVFVPGKTDFTDAGFAGVIVAWETPLDSARWHTGVEVQLNQHFGQNDHQELVVPVTIRYSPARPWLPVIDSFAFGIGLSYATSTPTVEINRRGASQRTLAYFSLETAFATGHADTDVFLRLHHRSDAYGLFARDSGSNAFAIGLRTSF
ncbi:hypothetical protein [Roseovarius aestuariivivens]|uniref:hypothetical protein n=1 Tax=Roseovarius aestuariivivens TaxID=1888910 RepID=UPI0010810485|nr:hypothetical protein [Roseovarius aestuariivivens]